MRCDQKVKNEALWWEVKNEAPESMWRNQISVSKALEQSQLFDAFPQGYSCVFITTIFYVQNLSVDLQRTSLLIWRLKYRSGLIEAPFWTDWSPVLQLKPRSRLIEAPFLDRLKLRSEPIEAPFWTDSSPVLDRLKSRSESIEVPL